MSPRSGSAVVFAPLSGTGPREGGFCTKRSGGFRGAGGLVVSYWGLGQFAWSAWMMQEAQGPGPRGVCCVCEDQEQNNMNMN